MDKKWCYYATDKPNDILSLQDNGATTYSQCQWHDLWPVGQIMYEIWLMDKKWYNFATINQVRCHFNQKNMQNIYKYQ